MNISADLLDDQFIQFIYVHHLPIQFINLHVIILVILLF